MPGNGSIQKRDAHEMTHGRPVQFGAGEHGTEQQEDEDQEDIQTE